MSSELQNGPKGLQWTAGMSHRPQILGPQVNSQGPWLVVVGYQCCWGRKSTLVFQCMWPGLSEVSTKGGIGMRCAAGLWMWFIAPLGLRDSVSLLHSGMGRTATSTCRAMPLKGWCRRLWLGSSRPQLMKSVWVVLINQFVLRHRLSAPDVLAQDQILSHAEPCWTPPFWIRLKQARLCWAYADGRCWACVGPILSLGWTYICWLLGLPKKIGRHSGNKKEQPRIPEEKCFPTPRR